jgi:hypothetical protein
MEFNFFKKQKPSGSEVEIVEPGAKVQAQEQEGNPEDMDIVMQVCNEGEELGKVIDQHPEEEVSTKNKSPRQGLSRKAAFVMLGFTVMSGAIGCTHGAAGRIIERGLLGGQTVDEIDRSQRNAVMQQERMQRLEFNGYMRAIQARQAQRARVDKVAGAIIGDELDKIRRSQGSIEMKMNNLQNIVDRFGLY